MVAPKMQQLKLSDIDYDPHYYPRVNGKEDWYTVNIFRENLLADPRLANPSKCSEAFPPIHVVKTPPGYKYKYMLLDGLHRCKGFNAAGFDVIWAIVERLPKSKWMQRATELNIQHKRVLDPGDKAWIAERLESDGMEVKDIASLLKMRVESLQKIRITRCQKLKVKEAKKISHGRSNRQVNGKAVGFLKAPLGELANTNRGTEALRHQGPIASGNVLHVLNSFIALMQAGAVDERNEEVAARMGMIRGLVTEVKARA